jgi:hypothetical protein
LDLNSAEENDFRIPGNHRARDEHYNDHNSEFHIALHNTACTIKTPALSLRPFAEKARVLKWGRREGVECRVREENSWKQIQPGTSTSASEKTSAVKSSPET